MKLITKSIFAFGLLLFATASQAQTSEQLPEGTREQYTTYRDNSISDEFNGTEVNTTKWGRRSTGTSTTSEHHTDASLVQMEKDTHKDGTSTKYVSIKATAKDGPIRTAGLVTKSTAFYGFYVVRFRFRGFDTPDVKEKGSIWHPSGMLEGKKVSVYPNPVNNQLNVTLPQLSSSVETAQIIDLNGKELYSYTAREIAAMGNALTIDVDGLAKGLYVLKLTTSSELMQTKFIKQ